MELHGSYAVGYKIKSKRTLFNEQLERQGKKQLSVDEWKKVNNGL